MQKREIKINALCAVSNAKDTFIATVFNKNGKLRKHVLLFPISKSIFKQSTGVYLQTLRKKTYLFMQIFTTLFCGFLDSQIDHSENIELSPISILFIFYALR